jgi:hypothetical protein
MATIKSYTDLEQSKKLAEILPLESADHHYVRKTCDFRGNPVDGKWSIPKYGNPQSSHANYLVQNFTSYEIIPCWSLAVLLNLCPTINGKQPILTRGKITRLWYCYYEDEIDTQTYDNPVDAVFEMIQLLHEQKLI